MGTAWNPQGENKSGEKPWGIGTKQYAWLWVKTGLPGLTSQNEQNEQLPRSTYPGLGKGLDPQPGQGQQDGHHACPTRYGSFKPYKPRPTCPKDGSNTESNKQKRCGFGRKNTYTHTTEGHSFRLDHWYTLLVSCTFSCRPPLLELELPFRGRSHPSVLDEAGYSLKAMNAEQDYIANKPVTSTRPLHEPSFFLALHQRFFS